VNWRVDQQRPCIETARFGGPFAFQMVLATMGIASRPRTPIDVEQDGQLQGLLYPGRGDA
jgi:hypothetical protein